MNKKRILVVTSSRSDFSILSGLIIKLKKNKRFITKILASGSHYSKKHGLTINELSENNLKADFSIPLNYRNDSIKSNLSNISKVAKDVDSRTMSLQYFETLKELGSSASTKFIFPMEFTNLLKPFLNMTKNDDSETLNK